VEPMHGDHQVVEVPDQLPLQFRDRLRPSVGGDLRDRLRLLPGDALEAAAVEAVRIDLPGNRLALERDDDEDVFAFRARERRALEHLYLARVQRFDSGSKLVAAPAE